jgi:hypothetical protein
MVTLVPLFTNSVAVPADKLSIFKEPEVDPVAVFT